MSQLVFPKAEYPTIIKGEVWADALRLESLDGSEMYLDADTFNMMFQFRSTAFKDSASYASIGGRFILKDFKPFNFREKTWGVTHLQKLSRKGWLKVDPDCNHRWIFWKQQQRDANGNWMSGTERGLYTRYGSKNPFKCWRWDVAGTMIEGVKRHWIPSHLNVYGHWD